MMRKFSEKHDKSVKNYYKDRFFIADESAKFDPNETKFADDIKILSDIKILTAYVEFDTLVINVEKSEILSALKILKDAGYTLLCELSGVDFIEQKGAIEVFYQLLDMSRTRRARVRAMVKQGEFLSSVTALYKSANWAERELYDMMGVWIEGHPALSRILMPDDWLGHPLLKSYPLEGDEFAKWYEVDKIFGRENRDIIGAENRTPAMIDEKDTFNFSQLRHETSYGEERPQKPFAQEYQEEHGVRFVTRSKRGVYKIITKRK